MSEGGVIVTIVIVQSEYPEGRVVAPIGVQSQRLMPERRIVTATGQGAEGARSKGRILTGPRDRDIDRRWLWSEVELR